jgi:anti-sigma B factor antagonist
VSEHQHSREHPVADISRRRNAVVVRLVGELDLYNAPIVRDALLAAAADGAPRLVVDLTEVEFVDSTVLGVLVETSARLAQASAQLVLAGPGLEPRRALETSGLARVFTVRETVDEALDS